MARLKTGVNEGKENDAPEELVRGVEGVKGGCSSRAILPVYLKEAPR